METFDEETYNKYCYQVYLSLIKYGDFSKEQGQKIIDEDFSNEALNEMDKGLNMHEVSYYWAMSYKYRNNEWIHNPELWPPPKEYEDWNKRYWTK